MKMNKIFITVSGGCAYVMEDTVPKGYEVEVIDFDNIEAGDDFLIVEPVEEDEVIPRDSWAAEAGADFLFPQHWRPVPGPAVSHREWLFGEQYLCDTERLESRRHDLRRAAQHLFRQRAVGRVLHGDSV